MRASSSSARAEVAEQVVGPRRPCKPCEEGRTALIAAAATAASALRQRGNAHYEAIP